MSNSNIIVFNGRLLSASETFIRAQGEGLQKFTPYYVGARRVRGLSLPPERTLVVNQGSAPGVVEEVLFKIYGFAPKFYKKIQKLNPVLIHAHFGVCGALALPLKAKLNVPMVVTFHGLDATMTDSYARKNSLSTRIYLKRREALKCEATLFIGVSEFIKQRLIAQGFPSEKVITHALGVDIEQFQSEPAKLSRQPIVLFVGRFSEKKGCEYLIRAMAEVQKVATEIELILIGDGELRPELEVLASKLLCRYQFLGFQPQSVVKSWMDRSMLLVVPSVTAANGDSEGLPTVVVEAQAMGLPVVASNHAGIPQAVIHGETGFLTAERDIAGLAESILRLLEDPELWQRFSLNGKEHVQKNFNLEKQTRILENIYESVLENKALK
ncbi:glycosyltransferase [Chamaesiphon minutus]|uniref:Glycosyltransferase n=1 Tax=Chamaesiphon minutus (strain ATCC 27169 / PCC 6605) TaxID=1173020 RepID=K9UNX8_CHAP6|nr:glycosyltransferase [Chamaesiphon minutus]AFY96782.1 glycosyltransferase [Chamaesiphon minutus PCC 6605]